jgi:3-dehydroquinate synthetase
LGTATLDLVTLRGVVLARHRRQPDSAGAVMRHDEHVAALERTVLAAFTDRAPCRRKVRRPPSAAARAEAERLRGPATTAAGGEVVVDFSAYVAAAAARGHIPSPDTSNADATTDGGAR